MGDDGQHRDGRRLGPQFFTGTVATDAVPMPSFGHEVQRQRAAGEAAGFVNGVSGTSAPTSFEAMASSEVMLSPAGRRRCRSPGTTIVMSPVAGA